MSPDTNKRNEPIRNTTNTEQPLNSSDIKEGERYLSAENSSINVRVEKIDRTKGMVYWKHTSGPLVESRTEGEMSLADFGRQFRKERAA